MTRIQKVLAATCLVTASMACLRWESGGDETSTSSPARRTEPPVVARAERSAAPAPAAVDVEVARDAAEAAGSDDATGLLQPSRGIERTLDLFDDDPGLGGEPVDRAALAADIRSDPQLARALESQASPQGE